MKRAGSVTIQDMSMFQPTTPFRSEDKLGPLGVILANMGDAPFQVAHGARIAQAVVAPVVQVRLVQAGRLPETARNTGGFGSTGAK